MTARSLGLALFAVAGLVAAAIYVLFNPLPWLVAETPKPIVAKAPVVVVERDGRRDGPPAREETKPAKMPGLFDVARIDPDGISVFAGQAAPNETVAVLVDGERVGTATADNNGDWVLVTDRKIATPNPRLSIAYGQQVPVPGRLAGDSGAVGREVRTASADPRDAPRTVRDVEARIMTKLGALVEAARREAAASSGAPSPSSPGAPSRGGGDEASGDRSPSVASSSTATSSSSASSGAMSSAIESASSTSAAAGSTRDGASQAGSGGSSVVAGGNTLPVPIRFIYREAKFTAQGRAAAELLLEYLKIKKVSQVTLTGHADERGSHDLNMALSEQRLSAVESYLRSGGYAGELRLVPKGKMEPYDGIERGRFEQQALYELDRRVELKVYH